MEGREIQVSPLNRNNGMGNVTLWWKWEGRVEERIPGGRANIKDPFKESRTS